MIFKYPAHRHNFRAQFLFLRIMAAANTQVNHVGTALQDVLDFFIQSLILPGKVAAAAAFHKSQDFLQLRSVDHL